MAYVRLALLLKRWTVLRGPYRGDRTTGTVPRGPYRGDSTAGTVPQGPDRRDRTAGKKTRGDSGKKGLMSGSS